MGWSSSFGKIAGFAASPLGPVGGLLGGKAGEWNKKITDPLGLFDGADPLGSPEKQRDPNEVAREEAIDSAIESEIVTKNKRSRSSTMGAGSNFLRQQTEGFEDTGPSQFFDTRLKKNRKMLKNK